MEHSRQARGNYFWLHYSPWPDNFRIWLRNKLRVISPAMRQASGLQRGKDFLSILIG